MRMIGIVFVFSAFLASLAAAGVSPAPQGTATFTFESPDDAPDLVRLVLEIDPWDGEGVVDWREHLRIVAVDDAAASDFKSLPQLLGSFQEKRVGTALRVVFQPRFPPSPGLRLEARFDGARWGLESQRASFVVPELTRAPSTRVIGSDPAGETLPSNLLRLYVHFSAPMSADGVLDHVRLLDADGNDVPVAFVGVPGGLWDAGRRRLTMLIHPGRVKRGVGPQQTLGGVLEEDAVYRLVIDEEALDDAGLPLAGSYERAFRIVAPDYAPPDPRAWTIEPPAAPDAPLRVALREPADRALLTRLLRVRAADGAALAGDVEVSSDARRWTFRPHESWTSGAYELIVPPELEDPSGNRPGRRFEEPVDTAREAGEAVLLRFKVP